MADFTLTTAALPVAEAKKGEIEELKDEALPLDTLERWLLEIKRQPAWRREADRASDYYDGNQLSADVLEILRERGQPELMTNLVQPTVDAVLGMEAKTRTDWVVRPDDNNQANDDLAEALSVKLKHAETRSRADRACSDAYAAQVKSGMGWVEVARESDPFKSPHRVKYVHRREIFWDWHSQEPDLSDARYLVRRRWTDLDIAIAALPRFAELLRYTTNAWANFDYMVSGDTGLRRSFEIERETSLDYTDWRDSERERVCLYEVWYRKPVRGYVMRLPGGQVVEVDLDNQRHAEAIAAGVVRPREATFQRVRVAFYAGPHSLFDVPSPYRHMLFPYIPFFGKREDLTNAPYGLVRSMMSPQDEVNARKSKMLWLLNSRRIIADQDAVVDHEEAAREAARPDAYFKLNPNRRPDSRFEIEVGGELAAQQFSAMQESKQEIAQASGVHQPMVGDSKQGQSGLAINTLIEQGVTTLGEINDNYRFARRLVGELLLELVKEECAEPNFTVTVGEGDDAREIVLNQETPDGSVQNDVRRVNVSVALDDLPATPTFRQQLFTQMAELTKALPEQLQAAVVDLVVEQSGAPKAKEFAQRIRRVTGAGKDNQDAQQQAAQLQQATLEAELKAKLADAEKTMAEAAEIRARVAAGPEGGDAQALIDRLRAVEDKARKEADALRTKIAKLEVALEDKSAEIEADKEVKIRVAEINARSKVSAAEVTATAQVPTNELETRVAVLEKSVDGGAQAAAQPAPAKEPAKPKPTGPKRVSVKRQADGSLTGHVEGHDGSKRPIRVSKDAEGNVSAEFTQ